MKNIIAILSLLMLISCADRNANLEFALKMAGENRKELEKVLIYYNNPADSLKLKAAEFLIENMPWHYSYGGKFMEEYRQKIDSMHPDLPIEMRMALYTSPKVLSENQHSIKIVRDIEVVTADFLIHNIDISFERWQQCYWLRELSFEDFCNYLLPYRIDNEPLVCWKDSVSEKMKHEVDDLAHYLSEIKRDPYSMYDFLDNSMSELLRTYFLEKVELPNRDTCEFDCTMASTASTYFWRMIGIPMALDFVPIYGHGNNSHTDIAIIDPQSPVGSISIERLQHIAKIYRKTYAVNREQVLTHTEEYVPDVAKNPLYKDVTAEYVRSVDVTLRPTTGKDRPKRLYLGLFSLGWKPVAHAELRNGQAIFKDVGVGVVYAPFYYKDRRQVMVSNPFYLNAKGELHYFEPNRKETHTVTLTRKYKHEWYKFWWSKVFVYGRFEASNNAQFTDAAELHTISRRTYWERVKVPIDAEAPACRYYRFVTGYPVDLAEIHFYDVNGKEIEGKIVGDKQTMAHADLLHINDNDMLSFAKITSWVGVDFGQKVSLGSIEYMPRNDTNGIYPGMKYELLYFDTNQWVSLGIKIATDYAITYQDVPKGALLWLRNLTEGKEERIFVYENEQQQWY